ncbi:MAG TPA: glycosyltransferase family 4 protein [Chloroflexota bacterium]|nr:glycosyltransferase family 4 protein [Chloroflexota bacterium]
MKVGIYNQFLTTMGGGERHMGTVAETLALAGHDVEIVTHVPASIEKLASRFALDLRGVRLRTTPLLPFDQLADLSAEYDLWINGSHMSVIPARAPRSILLVMFPFPLDLSPVGRLKRAVAERIHRQLLVPRFQEGFFGPQELGGTRYRWTAGRGQVVIETPWRGRALPLRLVLGSFRPAGWEPVTVRLTANGEPLAEREVGTTPGNYVTWDVTVPAELAGEREVRLTIESPVFRPFEVGGTSGEPNDFREVGVAVARVMTRNVRHYAYEALFERAVPELSRRLHGLPDLRAMGYLATYDAILPISEFSAEWLARYWGQRERVSILYPPVDVHLYTPRGARRKVILGIGRFQKGGHEKKQLEMIRLFRRMVRDGLSGWELHLVGGSMSDAMHRTYLERCRRAARGLPVTLHVDAPADTLQELIETSSIYWHATGYGERDPIKFEHFGISIVEAMAGGCVPIIAAKGAAAELVDDGESGYVWETMAEWRRRTEEVIADEALRQRLAARAAERARRFGRDVFRGTLLGVVERLNRDVNRGHGQARAAVASTPAPERAAPIPNDAGS